MLLGLIVDGRLVLCRGLGAFGDGVEESFGCDEVEPECLGEGCEDALGRTDWRPRVSLFDAADQVRVTPERDVQIGRLPLLVVAGVFGIELPQVSGHPLDEGVDAVGRVPLVWVAAGREAEQLADVEHPRV